MRRRLLHILLATTAIGLAAGAYHATRPALPTTPPDQRSQALSQFIARKKFLAEPAFFYPGAVNEADRAMFEAKVNALAERLQRLAPAQQTKAEVLGQFKVTMREFDRADSEDRDRFLRYLEELMDIHGIESSEGLLNQWRYGFDPK